MSEPKKRKPPMDVRVTVYLKDGGTAEYVGCAYRADMMQSALVVSAPKGPYDRKPVAMFAPGRWVSVSLKDEPCEEASR